MNKLSFLSFVILFTCIADFAEAATWQERALGKVGFVIGLGVLVFLLPVIWKAVFRNKK